MNTILSVLHKRFFVLQPPVAPPAAVPLSLLSRLGLSRLAENCLLKRGRSEQTYASFAHYFMDQGVSASLLKGTYDVLAQKSLLAHFPVHPHDSLSRVYGIDCYRDNEAGDLMNLIKKTCSLEFYRPMPVFLPCETVEDLVRLLAARCDATPLFANRTSSLSADKSCAIKITNFSV